MNKLLATLLASLALALVNGEEPGDEADSGSTEEEGATGEEKDATRIFENIGVWPPLFMVVAVFVVVCPLVWGLDMQDKKDKARREEEKMEADAETAVTTQA